MYSYLNVLMHIEVPLRRWRHRIPSPPPLPGSACGPLFPQLGAQQLRPAFHGGV